MRCRRIPKTPLQFSELTSSIVPHFETKIAPLRTQWRDDQHCGPMYPLKDGNLFRGILNWLSAARSVVSKRTKTVLLTTVSVKIFLYFKLKKTNKNYQQYWPYYMDFIQQKKSEILEPFCIVLNCVLLRREHK